MVNLYFYVTMIIYQDVIRIICAFLDTSRETFQHMMHCSLQYHKEYYILPCISTVSCLLWYHAHTQCTVPDGYNLTHTKRIVI